MPHETRAMEGEPANRENLLADVGSDTPVILVQAGRREDWASIGPVLIAAALEGYPRISFVVRQGRSDEGPAFDWSRFATP